MISNLSYDCDVIIVGAGPAGCTAATILAEEKGKKVIVLEKEHFPRYHVGESLIPHCYDTIERLGMVDRLNEKGFQSKQSVQFVNPDGKVSAPFYFAKHSDHPRSKSWQVDRETFDTMMMERARESGAEVREGVNVIGFIEEDGFIVGVKAESADGSRFELRAPMTMDASGRDAIFQRKKKWRKRDPKLNKIAIWTNYKGAKRDPGIDEGATTVAYVEGKGWFWNIPLKDDIVSTGIVAERDYLYRGSRDLKEIYEREIKENKWIEEHLSEGEQFGKYWVAGEYSYRAEHCATDGLVLIGDAFSFLDPVFSSGVYLALTSGAMGADAVAAALENKDTRAEQFLPYGERLCKGIEWMRKLVYAFYDENFSFKDVVMKYEEVQHSLTDCLIGDLIDHDYTELFERVSEFAELPEDLPHGKSVASGVGV
ncbi:tryptophan 7-halogenase [Akkermansiaceae bacterium]|jgi:flavin-dependent dehydrogenase|nr:tryptophan 7-halogenase [Akkermansiaceae bacterium]MDB4519774.1 tryptophan 7-halogenase [Akkermansiaceae bacterium]